MKKILVLSIIVLFCTLNTFAQDFIYLKNGDRISAIIKESTKTSVIYNEYGSADVSLKIINNDEIKMIAFSNGKVNNFNKKEKTSANSEFNKNLFAYHLADLLINNLTISYERILDNGKIGLQIPFSVGYSGDYQELGDFKNKFYSGINLNFYPTGQGNWRFFLGPGIRLGKGTLEDYYYSSYNSSDYYEEEDLFYFKFHINNGVMFSPIPELSLVAELSLGIRYMDSKFSDEKTRTTGAFSFNMIYRF